MPIYEYDCSACGRRIEVMHSVHGTGPATCEACGGAMKKALSLPAIHFKGSGWAKKDAKSSTAPAASTGAKTDGVAATDGEAPAPATPASTPAAAPAATSTPAAPAAPAAGGTGS
jgi:putative FmdB family regulatory protein